MAGTELAKAYVQIIPSADGIKGKLTNILGGEADSAGKSAGNSLGSSLVSAIKKVVVSAGIGASIKEALTEGADLQQSLGGVETLFKDSADTVIANAKNAYKTAGMSANDYMETVTSFSASLLQGLSGDTNKAADIADMALTDMSDNANKMGTSMELIQNAYQGFAKQNYTMLDNLKLGYGGTKTEMERLLADAQKLTGIEYNIDNLGDVYSAIHVIQEEMGITGTTAKEASETFSGSLASMKAAAQDVLGNLALGEDIKPSLRALVDTARTFLNKNLFPMLGNVISGIPYALEVALTAAIGELNVISRNADAIVEYGINLISQLVVGIISALPYLAETAVNIVSSLGAAIINTDWIAVASNFMTELRKGLDMAAIEILGTDGDIVGSAITAITAMLPDVLNTGTEMAMNFVTGILNSIPSLVESAGTLLNQFVEFIIANLPVVLESGVELLLSLVDGIIQNLPQIASSAISTIGKLVSTLLSNAPRLLETGITLLGKLTAGLISAVPALISKLPGIISQIKSSFSNIDWKSIGTNIIGGIARGISNGISSIISAARDAAQRALKAAKNALGIRSPSKAFENEVGKMIDMGLAAGIDNNIKAVSASMKNLSKATIGMIDTDFALPEAMTVDAVQRQDNRDGSLDETILQIINQITVDGTPLKEVVSNYTINKINARQANALRAKGAYL